MNALGFILACALAYALTPVVLVALERHGILDRPTQPRKIHSTPMPVGGGVAIYLAFFGTVLALSFWQDEPLLRLGSLQLWGLFAASTFIVAAGLWDDAYRMRPAVKLGAQIIAGLILYYSGYHIGLVTNPFGGQLELGGWDMNLTVLWVVAMCNAINLIDGLDGLACGVAMIAALTLAAIGLYPADYSRDVPFLCFAVAGAALGFLRYNYYPARIFLGDAGSMLLGLLLAAIALVSARKSSTAIALLMPLVALAVPMLDTALAILRRSSSGAGIFTADGEHLHHRLLRLGVSHEDVVKIFYFVSVWLGMVAFTFVLIPNRYGIIVFGVLGLGLLFAVEALAFVEATMHGRTRPRPALPLSAPLRWVSRNVLEAPARRIEDWVRRRWPEPPAEAPQQQAESEPAAIVTATPVPGASSNHEA
jgi:UDP-GlcNAc:undecaprenyl-phosphate/decaprenyl-phosphate GlcNAc-1-phosphate transferase